MQPVEQDIVAALLKSIWEQGLISEPTYHVALNKLICTFNPDRSIDHDSAIKSKKTA